MAVLFSRATGNFTTSTTWGVVDATSYSNSESTTTVVTTSYQTSSTFTPGAITIDGIAVKLSVRTGTTGTFTVALDLATVTVTGTEVAINCADFPVAATADNNGGWHFIEFASPVLLLAATAYGVKVKTSSSSQISLFATATTNWSRCLVTTTNQTPVAGDDLIVGGEMTGAGTGNNFEVTMDETATTDYGNGTTTLVTPAVAICHMGTLTWGTTAATNYNLKLSGNLIIYSNGTYNMGTVATPCPRDSSMTLLYDCATNVDYGFWIRNLGTAVIQGQSRSSGKIIDRCKLNTDEAANQTTLGVDTDTGWLDNDVIAVASTTQTNTQSETGTLNGAAGASSLTVDGFGGAGGGLATSHSGTSPTQAEVILLSRNVVIMGTSATLQAYVNVTATASLDADWCRFTWLGSATANKRGIDIATTTGTVSFNYCSLDNFIVTSARGINTSGSSGTGLSINNMVSYLIANEHFNLVATSGSASVNNWTAIRSTTAGSVGFSIIDLGSTVTNCTAVSMAGEGFTISESAGVVGTWSGNVAHSNGSYGVQITNASPNVAFGSFTSWRNTGTGGLNVASGSSGPSGVVIDGLVCFGNVTNSVRVLNNYLVLYNPVLSGDTTFATTNGISCQGNASCSEIWVYNGDLSTVTGIKTAHTNDINLATVGSIYRVFLNNCKLGGTNELNAQSNLPLYSGFVASQRHDQTAGLHKIFKRTGTITIETTTVDAGGFSVKMTPSSATFKLELTGECGGFQCAVGSGQTVAVSVKVQEDGSYNGNRARLILKRNDSIGISADTVLDTATAASDGAWETLSATTASASEDGVMEFVVDCDGTAGNLFVDTWSVT